MFAAVHVPQMGLQLRLRLAEAPDRPAALLELPSAVKADRRGLTPIVELNDAALAAGVRRGQTASQALARCAHLRLWPRDPAAEVEAQQRLLEWTAEMTPDHEDTAPGLVLADFHQHRGAAFEGVLDFYRRKSGLDVRLGLARTPDAAHLAAHLTTPDEPLCHVPPEATAARRFLAPLPVSCLAHVPAAALPAETLAVLGLWGIRTLGALGDLSRDEVVRRLGSTAGPAWDLATAKRQRLLRLVRAVEDYTVRGDLEEPVVALEPLLFLLRRQLDTLTGRLRAAHLATGVLRLGLRFENGAAHERDLRPAEPTTDPELLQRLLHVHLGTVRLPAPVSAWSLALEPVRPAISHRDLLQPGVADPVTFGETLGELAALLGPDRVGTPELLPTRRADGFVVKPPDVTSVPTPPSAGAEPALDPPWRRLRPGVPVEVTLRHGVPVHVHAARFGGPVTAANGPHFASGEWWDPGIRWQQKEWEALVGPDTLLLVQLGDGAWEIAAVR